MANYDESSIKILEGLEAVRKRPGMYIGSTDKRGMHHLVWEIVDNAIDEVINGYGNYIKVIINKDKSITVADNGRGVPIGMHASGKSTPEVIYTILHAGGKFTEAGYKVSGGLHGVGASVVNALSKEMQVVIYRDGLISSIEFENGGHVKTPLHTVGKSNKTGTIVKFLPDDTIFKNCHGIDEDGHVTSPYDIALMSRELLTKHPNITKYTTIWMDSLRDGKSQLVNTNKLIKTYRGITGLKTGSTSLALYNLSASATRDDLSLIAVIMKAPSTKIRFAEAQKLLDYGFNKFSFKNFGNKGYVIQNVSVNKGVKNNCDAILENSAGTLIEKGKESQVTQSIEINNNIEAPIKKGDIIGKVVFSLDGSILSSTNLVASCDINKINLFTMSKKIIYSWVDLLRS